MSAFSEAVQTAMTLVPATSQSTGTAANLPKNKGVGGGSSATISEAELQFQISMLKLGSDISSEHLKNLDLQASYTAQLLTQEMIQGCISVD